MYKKEHSIFCSHIKSEQHPQEEVNKGWLYLENLLK